MGIMSPANAAHIVRAVNAFEGLVEALVDAIAQLEELEGNTGSGESAALTNLRTALAKVKAKGEG